MFMKVVNITGGVLCQECARDRRKVVDAFFFSFTGPALLYLILAVMNLKKCNKNLQMNCSNKDALFHSCHEHFVSMRSLLGFIMLRAAAISGNMNNG